MFSVFAVPKIICIGVGQVVPQQTSAMMKYIGIYVDHANDQERVGKLYVFL